MKPKTLLVALVGVAALAALVLFTLRASPSDPCLINSVSRPTGASPDPTPMCTYTVVKAYPHDPTAFTEGLQFVEGVLYEGTGGHGYLSLRKAALDSGEILQRHDRDNLAPEYFGEGITVFKDKIYQLTWQAHEGFIYSKDTFELLGTFHYSTEGWGLTHDGQRLIMSDGTATLYVLDPAALTETGRVSVYDEHGPVTQLNELEYIHGSVYANVWKTNRIVRIDPASGRVIAWIDLTDLYNGPETQNPEAVLNGIAYDAQTDRLFVTGKLWPKLFEIKVQARK
jgi:glutamine cyclotransferase